MTNIIGPTKHNKSLCNSCYVHFVVIYTKTNFVLFVYCFVTAFGYPSENDSHLVSGLLVSIAAPLDINPVYEGLHSECKYTMVSAVCADQNFYSRIHIFKSICPILYGNGPRTCSRFKSNIRNFSVYKEFSVSIFFLIEVDHQVC